MNKCGTCNYKDVCKVPDDRRSLCKANDTPQPSRLIFGKTWEQIQAIQQKKDNRS